MLIQNVIIGTSSICTTAVITLKVDGKQVYEERMGDKRWIMFETIHTKTIKGLINIAKRQKLCELFKAKESFFITIHFNYFKKLNPAFISVRKN